MNMRTMSVISGAIIQKDWSNIPIGMPVIRICSGVTKKSMAHSLAPGTLDLKQHKSMKSYGLAIIDYGKLIRGQQPKECSMHEWS